VLALATLLLDPSADYEPPSEPAPWEPDPGPGTLGMLFETARERVMEPARFVMSAAGSDLHPLEAARTVVEGGGGLANLVQHLDMSSSPINGPTGPTRAYGFSRFSLSDFKGVKNAFGATINDVALAVVSGGFRKYLEQRGEDVDTLHLKALCPVSLRDDSQESPSGNELSMMLVPLATEEALPAARMRRAKFQVEAMKRDKQAVGADMLRRFASSLPGPLHPLLAKGMGKLAGFNTIVTNIPGPQLPLYCLGCRMVEAMPVAFLYDGQRLAVAILSYDGDITFGYISDGVALPDVDCLSASMEESFRELAAVTRGGKSAVSQRGKSNGVPEFAGMGPPRT
jgi:WS/DGAT/MGAT family acyltransferase